MLDNKLDYIYIYYSINILLLLNGGDIIILEIYKYKIDSINLIHII